MRWRRRRRSSSRRPAARCSARALTPSPSTTDFSAFLLRAQASGAKVIGLANAGADTVNCVKQAAEFGLQRAAQRIAALLMFDHRRACARPGHGAGPAADRSLLLGPERAHPRLHPALRGRKSGDRPPTWCRPAAMGDAALPEGGGRYGRGGGQGQRRGDGGADEGDADGRRRLRPRPHPGGWAEAAPGLSVPGEVAGREQ